MVTLPTAEQCAAFVDHVTWAHSWYKHLPPDGSAQFVVFLAEDAGAGFEQHERLHYGWKTTAEYRARYGFLDYAWRIDGAWNRDGAAFVPSDELLGVAGFRLGPACSSDFNAIEVICALHRDRFAELTRLADEYNATYDALNDDERALVVEESPIRSGPITRHLEAEQAMNACYERLFVLERRKIADAVERLLQSIRR